MPIDDIMMQVNALPGCPQMNKRWIRNVAQRLDAKRPDWFMAHINRVPAYAQVMEAAGSVSTGGDAQRTEKDIEFVDISWREAMDWGHVNGVPVGSRSEEEDLDAVNRLRDAFHLPWFRIID